MHSPFCFTAEFSGEIHHSAIKLLISVTGIVVLIFSVHSHADSLSGEQLLQQQRARQQVQRQQLTPVAPDVRLSATPGFVRTLTFPAESPCFVIQRVELLQRHTLPHWLPLDRLASQANGHCLGRQGINLLVQLLQNRIIASGW